MKKRVPAILMSAVLCFAAPAYAAEPTYLGRLNQLQSENYHLTREDFCAVIAQAFYDEPEPSAELPFADADELAAENIPWLAKLYANEILFGVPADGRLYMSPGSSVTRQEALTLLGRVLAKTSEQTPAFTDADEIAPYALGYVSWFAGQGIVLGYPDGSFGPTKNMTAGELAALVTRTLNFKHMNEIQITTYSGTGGRGLLDGDKATAKFLLPYGVTRDPAGGLIVFDTYNNAVRKLNAGKATTLTGSVTVLDDNRFPKGYYKDGELADALLNRPTGGVFNSKGELFICDSANNAVRYVSGGELQTAGTEFNNPMAIAIDSEDNIYVADTLNNCIRRISADGGITVVAGVPGKEGYADGAADEALFRAPSGIAVSGGVIYIADTGNHILRKLENGEVTTLAGTVTDFDEDGYPLGGFENGHAATAMFSLPMGLAVSNGVLVVADSGNNMIRAVTKSGAVVTVAGSGEPGDTDGGALDAMLSQPMGVCVYGETLYIADTGNNKLKSMAFDPGVYGN